MAGTEDIDPHIFRPAFDSSIHGAGSDRIKLLLSTLKLQKHPEGGYFVETDRDQRLVPNPFPDQDPQDVQRTASTTIYYLLTPSTSFGAFHRNKGRTIHTLHKGRGRYVIIHADEAGANGGPARVETFIVGHDVQHGERLQWIVEANKYKASFLLPDDGSDSSGEGLLISETVVPGFEFKDHDFMAESAFQTIIPEAYQKDLLWLLRQP